MTHFHDLFVSIPDDVLAMKPINKKKLVTSIAITSNDALILTVWTTIGLVSNTLSPSTYIVALSSVITFSLIILCDPDGDGDDDDGDDGGVSARLKVVDLGIDFRVCVGCWSSPEFVVYWVAENAIIIS